MQQQTEPAQLRLASRCLAKTRRGTPCQSPATKHGRCRMHGGAPGTGAPTGKANGNWKHGQYSKESRAPPAPLPVDARSQGHARQVLTEFCLASDGVENRLVGMLKD